MEIYGHLRKDNILYSTVYKKVDHKVLCYVSFWGVGISYPQWIFNPEHLYFFTVFSLFLIQEASRSLFAAGNAFAFGWCTNIAKSGDLCLYWMMCR